MSTQSVSRSIILGLFALLKVIVRLKLTAIKLIIIAQLDPASGSSNLEKPAIKNKSLILAGDSQNVLMEIVERLTLFRSEKLHYRMFSLKVWLLLYVPQDTQSTAQMDSIVASNHPKQTLLK